MPSSRSSFAMSLSPFRSRLSLMVSLCRGPSKYAPSKPLQSATSLSTQLALPLLHHPLLLPLLLLLVSQPLLPLLSLLHLFLKSLSVVLEAEIVEVPWTWPSFVLYVFFSLSLSSLFYYHHHYHDLIEGKKKEHQTDNEIWGRKA
jgi:hypothetical protein